MFVDHEKYRAFDVERHSTTCVCGKVADSFETGYCSECTEKKEKYINNVVGTIELDDEVANLVVDPLETLRVKTTSDRISFLIDSYIKEYNAEPYDNTAFFIRCLSDKNEVMEELKSDLELYEYIGKRDAKLPLSRKRFVVDAYGDYLCKVSAMLCGDMNLITALGDVPAHKLQVEADSIVDKLTKEKED